MLAEELTASFGISAHLPPESRKIFPGMIVDTDGWAKEGLESGLFYPMVEFNILTGVESLVYVSDFFEHIFVVGTANAHRTNKTFLI